MNKRPLMVALSLPVWLAGCAVQAPPASVGATIPSQWQASMPADLGTSILPHGGRPTALLQWWQERGDPLLVQLIDAAQAVSPTIATARSRIEQARALRVSSSAALLPTLDGSLNASRSNAQIGVPLGTAVTAGAQAAWEIDLFGANRSNRDAAQARLDASQAGWHDARVAVAVEVANRYYSLRSCEKLLDVTHFDATSRAETARLADLSANAGFQAPATAALARASAAEGNARATQQRASCDLDIKALVALTGLEEPALRQQIAAARGELPQDATLGIAMLPAATLAQRPDVFGAEREVAAASADVGSTQAQRYPRLSLSGNIG
ncbi:MAG: TolC family protein, partial [Herminiimonas sp.]|nr:TolC family protein [Herminiimonas sp.]